MHFESELDEVTFSLVEGDIPRAILIGNNGSNGEKFSQLALNAQDVLVQFNQAMFMERFSHICSHKVHIFNAAPDGRYWGFDAGETIRDACCAQKGVSLSFYFAHWLSDAAKAFVVGRRGQVKAGVLFSEGGCQHSYSVNHIPSAGFMAVVQFRLINLLRGLKRRPPIRIVLVGFTGQYTSDSAYAGHDFAYEQASYALWPEIERL